MSRFITINKSAPVETTRAPLHLRAGIVAKRKSDPCLIIDGEVQLTLTEERTAYLVMKGLKNKEIAQDMGTTEQVIKNYLHHIFEKMDIYNRTELAIWVAEKIAEAKRTDRWNRTKLGIWVAEREASEQNGPVASGLLSGINIPDVKLS